jgi:hypothetical protein
MIVYGHNTPTDGFLYAGLALVALLVAIGMSRARAVTTA